MGQVIDKGRIVAAVDKFQAKENGQFLFNQDNSPKMKNKWMAIGEATKWKNDDQSVSVTEKIYLRPVNVQGSYYETRTFWDSDNTNQQPSQHQGAQQQSQQQTGGFAPQNGQQGAVQQGYPQR